MALLVLAAWYLPFAAHVGLTGFVADDALYLLMADAFGATEPDDMMLNYVLQVAHLPPLYPLVLALAGGGSATLQIAHFVQAVLVLIALLTHGWLAREVFISDRHGLLVLLILATLPATLLLSTELWSEFLYLALSGGALIAALAARRYPPWWLLVAVLTGLAAVTRGAGAVLIAALLVTLAVRARRYVLPCSLLAVLPLLAVAALGLGGSSDYVEIFSRGVGDPAGLRSVVAGNLDALWHGYLTLFDPQPGRITEIVGAATLFLALFGLMWRLGAHELDAYYVAGYGLLLLVWPYPDHAPRLVYAIAPLLIILAGVGSASLGALVDWLLGSRPASLPLLALLVLSCASSAPLAGRYLTRLPSDLDGYHATRYWLSAASPAAGTADLRVKRAMARLMENAGSVVSPRDCIYARNPQAVMFYARRVSWPPATGDRRPTRPRCRFHLLLADDQVVTNYRALWPTYEVALQEEVAGGTAGVLVRYP
ncbi:MAG: hypothetical protein WD928_08605 [Gammaproteobacteria bacterium]